MDNSETAREAENGISNFKSVHQYMSSEMYGLQPGTMTTIDQPSNGSLPAPQQVVFQGGCQCQGLQQSWTNFLTEVSINGVKYVAQRETPIARRSIWLVLVLFGAVFMLYQVMECIFKYTAHPTSVDITMQHNTSLRFPAVTICSENTVIKSIVKEMGVYELGPLIRPPWPVPGQRPNFTAYKEPLDKITKEFDGDWDAFYSYVAHPFINTYNDLTNRTILGTLLECKFEGKPCSASDFIQVKTSMGVCYQFSSEALPKYTTVAGGSTGLQLVLFVNQGEYCGVLSKSAGFHVLIHDPLDSPQMQNHGLLVSPGCTTLLSMEYMHQVDLGPPYGNCYGGNPDDESPYRYTQCIEFCFAKFIHDRCDCINAYLQHPNASVCSPMQLYECILPAQYNFVRNKLEEKCGCPRQCEQLKYHPTISTGTVSRFLMEYLHQTMLTTFTQQEVEAHVRDEYVIMNIFFSDFSYMEVSVMPAYSFMSLLCDIGGALGLILGSLLLTVVEFIDFVIYFMCKAARAS